MDPLKRRIFDRAVRLHTADYSPQWDKIELTAAKLVSTAISPPTISSRLTLMCMRILAVLVNRALFRHYRMLFWGFIYIAPKQQFVWHYVNRSLVAQRVMQRLGIRRG